MPKLFCIVCNKQTSFKPIRTHEDMRWKCWNIPKKILQCPHCHLEILYPAWTKKELAKLYQGYHQQKDFPWQKQAVRISRYLPRYLAYDQLILEVGCGKGENVHYLTELGYTVLGIDKDETVCDNVKCLATDYMDIKEKHFCDVVYGIQLFEHIPDPTSFINKVFQFLRPNGKFILEIPNVKDPLVSLYKIPAFKTFYYLPHHLFFWTPNNIKTFMERLGVKVEIKLLQKYGILNHLRWLIFGVPGNWHPHVPIIDNIYKWILTRLFKISDTIIIIGEKSATHVCNCGSGNKSQRKSGHCQTAHSRSKGSRG